MIASRDRQFLVSGTAKIDELETSVAIAKLAPRHRGLAQVALSVHPDLEHRCVASLRAHPFSLSSNILKGLDIP
jgi:hypothetical protein